MPDSTLTPGVLVDDLVGVVDDIRADISAGLGTRPFTVTRVVRTWDGGRRGLGTPTEAEVVLSPAPHVVDLMRNAVHPNGLAEEGRILLTEISLTYSEDELYPRDLLDSQELFYRLEDAHGQSRATRYYAPAQPPRANRGMGKHGDIGWVMEMERAEDVVAI